MDAEGLDVPPPPYVEFSPDEIYDSYSSLTQESAVELEPPARTISPHQSRQPSTSEYTPIVYDVEDTQKFYGSLIDENGHPSKIMCRMSDALFFYVNNNCPRTDLRGTQFIEPSKLLWLVTAPENDVFDLVSLFTSTSASVAMSLPVVLKLFLQGPNAVRNLSMIYDAASIPYSLNTSRLPVLDRRGFFHWTTFEVRANPDESHPFWNKMMNIFKLVDPLTNIAFPTPLVRSNFPAASVPALDNLRKAWQRIAAFQTQHRQRSLNAQTSFVAEPQGIVSGEGQEWHMDDTQKALNRLALRKEHRQQVRKALQAGSVGRPRGQVMSEASAAQPTPRPSHPPPIPQSSRPLQRRSAILRPFLEELQSHVYPPSSPSASPPPQSLDPQSQGSPSPSRLGQLRPREIRKAVKHELLRQFGGLTLQPSPLSGPGGSASPQYTSNRDGATPLDPSPNEWQRRRSTGA
ncbi:hypothetical protein BU17DRAFT_91799 [Hysterangium stoloniferum]|nr:hypothetical protein BU17DRAFT_91799 [Hysterangium stoloniferum]